MRECIGLKNLSIEDVVELAYAMINCINFLLKIILQKVQKV
jgi:hypothetical protein